MTDALAPDTGEDRHETDVAISRELAPVPCWEWTEYELPRKSTIRPNPKYL